MDLSDVIDTLRREGYDVTQPLPDVLLVRGRFLNPERIALRAAGEAGDAAVGVWAISRENDWTLVGWNRPDLVTVNQRGAAQRWRHRRIPPAMRPDSQTFLEGGASPHDIVTTPKHRPTDAAREILSGLGIEAPEPPGWEPPPPPPTPVVPVAVPKPKRVRATAPRPAAPRKPEPVTKVCPTCFMALPATGICDTCG